MQSGTDQAIEATKQELNTLKDFLISPFLKLAPPSNHLTHEQPHRLNETHEARPLKPPAARYVNVQTGFSLAPGQRPAEPVCGVEGAELEKSTLHLQDKLVLRAGSQFSPSAEQCLFPATGKASGHLCCWEFSGSTFSINNSQLHRESPEQVQTSP